ncbi:MAG: metallophosphoesterase [Clostridia bacterium]|nr:metallophosphoesterase [Clostridia bacterium]
MIKLGIMSDTHGNSAALDRAYKALSDADAYVHLGDFVSDARVLETMTDKPVHAVRGNSDSFTPDHDNVPPKELVIEYEGVKLLLIHGHAHEVDAYFTLAARERAERLGCSVLLYGHTHIPQYRNYGDLSVINPGSPARPRGGSKPSVAEVIIDSGRVRARIIPLE